MTQFDARELATAINLGLVPSRKIALVAYVLDRSGSMVRHGQTPREELNTLIAEASKAPGAENALYLVASFATDLAIDIAPRRFTEARALNHYRAAGDTALYLASHKVLSLGFEFMDVACRAGFEPIVDVTILSDGENTAQYAWYGDAIESARRAREAGMHLSTVGIGISGERLAEILGFDMRNTQTVAGTREGIVEAMHTTRDRTTTTLGRTLTGDVLDRNGKTIRPGRHGTH